MKKYKVWIELEEIDESRDSYRNVGEPHEAGVFTKKSYAQTFITDQLLMAEAFGTRLRQLADNGLKFLANLPEDESTATTDNRMAFKRMLVEALKTPSKPLDDRCPKCGAQWAKRELIDRQFIDRDAIHVHYSCTACKSTITEEFMLNEVFIDDGR
jgi:hypothetical protein